MKRIITIGDIHGCIKELEKVLNICGYVPGKDKLVFIGDYINRGQDSLKVLRKIMKHVKEENAIALMGNHEEMFLEFIDEQDDFMFLTQKVGGHKMLENLLEEIGEDSSSPLDVQKIKTQIKEKFKDEIEFIRNLPLYHEEEGHLFVHAGVRAFNWRETEKSEFLWMGEEFYAEPTYLDKKVVFGHTPTCVLRKETTYDIWFSPHEDKIGIDGGCGFEGGQLNALVLSDKGYETHFVKYTP